MTKIVSHRGANTRAPENTFAAADLALEQGADYIELDVRESADGVLYVIHDETLDRTTNGTGPVGHMLSSEIDMLDAGEWFHEKFKGAVVPRLDAYLEHLRHRAGVYIELKHCDPAKVVALVRDLGMVRDTFYFSFSEEMRFQLQQIAPEFRKMMTLNIAKSPSLVGAVHHASIIEITPEQMRRPAIVEASRMAGLEIMVYYGGDDMDVHREIAAAGVDYVNLDRPDLFAAARRALNGVAA
ncbi:glycerophosphodiester phosphodiesterase [Rhizobium cremeum]|uniref:glycerophosphodiester phosphodiesterase n=1 Tax=Rhizobium cremeum TaxID=2813827 RepID=UPI000DDE92B8